MITYQCMFCDGNYLELAVMQGDEFNAIPYWWVCAACLRATEGE